MGSKAGGDSALDMKHGHGTSPGCLAPVSFSAAQEPLLSGSQSSLGSLMFSGP